LGYRFIFDKFAPLELSFCSTDTEDAATVDDERLGLSEASAKGGTHGDQHDGPRDARSPNRCSSRREEKMAHSSSFHGRVHCLLPRSERSPQRNERYSGEASGQQQTPPRGTARLEGEIRRGNCYQALTTVANTSRLLKALENEL
jgi:hypothetical protein